VVDTPACCKLATLDGGVLSGRVGVWPELRSFAPGRVMRLELDPVLVTGASDAPHAVWSHPHLEQIQIQSFQKCRALPFDPNLDLGGVASTPS
jgi:hypothetical protein